MSSSILHVNAAQDKDALDFHVRETDRQIGHIDSIDFVTVFAQLLLYLTKHRCRVSRACAVAEQAQHLHPSLFRCDQHTLPAGRKQHGE